MRLLSDNSGFGKIYTAEERGTSKILKVLKEHLNNQPKAVELFQQEAKVLAQFQHPGIPKVDIFLGNIYTWNDPRIAKDNPDIILPNLP